MDKKKLVKPCFGKYGNTECLWTLCDEYQECHSLYSNWYNKERKNMKLIDYIYNYFKLNKIRKLENGRQRN